MSDSEDVKAEELGQGDISEEPTSEEPSSQGEAQPAEIASQLMKNPQVLAALQNRLGDIVGSSSGYIQSLPKPVKRRIKALKKIQFNATKIEAEFYREVHKLECKYATRYAPLYEKRLAVVSGDHEPDDDEADWPSEDEKDDELSDTEKDTEDKSKEDVKTKASIDEKEKADDEEKESDAKGVPGFWLTIFKNVDMLSEMIQPHDEPILNVLRDVKVDFVDVNDIKDDKDPMGFKLQFHFDSNDYFENKVLTKEYVMRSVPDETDPFSFEGPEIVKCQGCTIDWKKGKNVTVKTVKKKQKHKASGTTRTISKTVQSDSFFNFFNPPTPPDDEEMDEDTEALLAADFEIGHFIRERIVPRAVLYFTGEALENDDDYEDGDEEEGGDDEYDEDADGDYNPEAGKFITPRFQAKCAKLALAQVPLPSSAPTDTRLYFRPNSVSNPRPSSVTGTSNQRPTSVSGTKPDGPPSANNTLVRPVTAPFSGQSNQSKSERSGSIQDKSQNVSKPTVVKDAFTKPVMNDDKENTDALSIENDDRVSTSSIKSAVKKEEQIRTNTEGARPKSVSFKTTKLVGIGDQGETPKLDKEGSCVPSSVIKPDNKVQAKLTREQTFFEQVHSQEKNSKGLKTNSKEKPSSSGKQSKRKEDLLEEGETRDIQKDQSKKSHEPRSSEQNSSEGEDGSPVVFVVREAEEQGDFKIVSAKTDTGLAKFRKTKNGGEGQKVSGKVKVNNSEMNAKLEKTLNGDESLKGFVDMRFLHPGNQSTGRAGVNNVAIHSEDVNKSNAKSDKVHVKKSAQSKDMAFAILKNLTGKRGPGSHKPGQVPNVTRKTRRYTFEKPTGPPPSTVIQAIINDKRQVDAKPSSSPSSLSAKPRIQAELKKSASQTLRSQNAGKSQSAPPRKENRQSVNVTDTTESGQPHDKKRPTASASPGFLKGVRLQNGMIATETDYSIDLTEPVNTGDFIDVPNVHPKFRESPYLKGNPLFMSGKQRLGASASSFGRRKDKSQ